MRGTEEPFAVAEGLPVQGDGLIQAPRLPVGAGEVVADVQGEEVLGPLTRSQSARVCSYSAMASSRRPAAR